VQQTAKNADAEPSPILIAEDDLALRQSIEWTLEVEGLSVETAADGQEALEWLGRRRPSLLLLDMGLPRVGGDGVAAGLHAAYGDDVPIVVITADGHAPEKARRVGATAYLQKPFDIDALVLTVRRALGIR
jgi:DNA-binding response OmpR family regulator